MSATPVWVTELVYRACAQFGLRVPVIVWRRGGPYRTRASGSCRPGRIVVTATKDRRDAREVVLHELAHLAAPDWHHGDRFYRYLYAMAAFDGRLSGTYVMNSERVTAQAAKTAKALGIRGATKAIRDRRAANRANRNVSRPRYVRCTFTDCPFTRSDGRPHTHAENTTIYHRDGRSWHVPMRAEAAA